MTDVTNDKSTETNTNITNTSTNMSTNTSTDLTIYDIFKKIETLEATLVTINADLIKQNIKLSEAALGKLPEPEEIVVNTPTEPKQKELYYTIKNERVCVFGPGTFDNKSVLKENGEWDSINKSWKLRITIEKTKELFPNILEK